MKQFSLGTGFRYITFKRNNILISTILVFIRESREKFPANRNLDECNGNRSYFGSSYIHVIMTSIFEDCNILLMFSEGL